MVYERYYVSQLGFNVLRLTTPNNYQSRPPKVSLLLLERLNSLFILHNRLCKSKGLRPQSFSNQTTILVVFSNAHATLLFNCIVAPCYIFIITSYLFIVNNFLGKIFKKVIFLFLLVILFVPFRRVHVYYNKLFIYRQQFSRKNFYGNYTRNARGRIISIFQATKNF